MRKLGFSFAVVLVLAAAALAAPRGLSGLSLGIGAGGLGDGYAQGEYDFRVSDYVCLGPEVAVGFGDSTSMYAGGAGRFYFVPNASPIFQPDLTFSAGMAHAFHDDGGWTGAYFRLAFGCDFDIPSSPVSPYMDLGGIFLAGDGSDTDFNAELGVRIAL